MSCEYCRSFPHKTRCPNADEPPIACYCDECKEPIYDGDTYYPIGRDKYCLECIESFKQWAEVDDYWED